MTRIYIFKFYDKLLIRGHYALRLELLDDYAIRNLYRFTSYKS